MVEEHINQQGGDIWPGDAEERLEYQRGTNHISKTRPKYTGVGIHQTRGGEIRQERVIAVGYPS